MRKLTLYCFIYLLAVPAIGQYSLVKRGLKLIEKGDWQKAEISTQKAFDKDSLYAGAFYLGSQLRFEPLHTIYNIDSAYHFINMALACFDSLEEKEQVRLAKIKVGVTEILSLRNNIDSTAFIRAVDQNTEGDFNYFLNHFITAKPFEEDAIKKRDSLAFITAKEQNTYQGYKIFLEKYPNAIRSEEATRLYERLYFTKSTADGKLLSYERFLKQHPKTPYRKEAEQNVFEIMTADNSPESYVRFLKNYRRSSFVTKARNFLYHIMKQRKLAFPSEFMTDSLKHVISLNDGMWYLFMEQRKYGFMDNSGKVVVDAKYDKPIDSYLCNAVTTDYLELDGQLIGRNEQIISKEPIESVDDLGFGWLRVKNNKKYGLVHKSGFQLLPIIHDDIKLIYDGFVAVQDNDLWNVLTLSGRSVLKDSFDDIFVEGEFVIFEQNGQYDLKTSKQLADAVDQEPIRFQFLFTDYELIAEDQLWLKSAYGETVYAPDQSELVPYAKQKINLLRRGFEVHSDDGFMLLDEQFKPALKEPAVKLISSLNWQGLKYEDSWQLRSAVDYAIIGPQLDSIALIGEYFALAFKSDSTWMYTEGKPYLLSHEATNISLVASGDVQYLQFMEKGELKVLNRLGKIIISDSDIQISLAGEEYLIITKKGKKGLISKNGKTLLKPKYEVIGSYDGSGVSIFKDKKFGLYSKKGAFIEPMSEEGITAYNDHLFKVKKSSRFGLVNGKGKELVPFEYEEITFWSDSTCLVKQNFQWRLYDIYEQAMVGTPIKSFQYIKNDSTEVIVIFLVENGYGVMSNVNGEVIAPTFNDLINIGTADKPVYFTEKHVEEAEFYIVIYYDKTGKVIRKQAFEAADYDLIYCND